MDAKVIFYIILGLIYLFAQSRKKAAAQPPPRRPQQEDGETNKPLTFEELLKEIEGAKKHEPSPASERPTEYQPEPYKPVTAKRDEEDLAEDWQEKMRQEAVRERQKTYVMYEEAKRQAFYRPSLEESVKLEDTIVRFATAKPYATSSRRDAGAPYREMLRNRDQFRKAFIASEILKTKF